jgi:hypothetical protein
VLPYVVYKKKVFMIQPSREVEVAVICLLQDTRTVRLRRPLYRNVGNLIVVVPDVFAPGVVDSSVRLKAANSIQWCSRKSREMSVHQAHGERTAAISRPSSGRGFLRWGSSAKKAWSFPP